MLKLTYNENADKILHMGPIQMRGGETTYRHFGELPYKSKEEWIKVLSLINKDKIVLQVEEITDPASVKTIEYEKTVKGIKYIGPQSVRTIRGLGAFMRAEIRSDLTIEQMHRLVEDYGEFELVT